MFRDSQWWLKLTTSGFDDFVHLLSRLHGTQVEELHRRSCILQFWGVVRRRSKLLEIPSPNAGSRLFSAHDRAVSEVAFHEQDHLLITHQDIVTTDIIQPSLQGSLDPNLVLIRASPRSSQRRGHGGNKGFGVIRDEVVRKFHEFGVCPSYISELSGSKFGQIGLGR